MKNQLKLMRVGLGLWMVSVLSSCQGAVSAEAKAAIEKQAEAAYSAGNYREAYMLMLPLAEKGDPDAQFGVAMLALQGVGFEKENPTLAERESASWIWAKKAAIGGNDEAIGYIADGYENGWYSAVKNGELAASWRKAIKRKAGIEESLALEKKLGVDSKPSAKP